MVVNLEYIIICIIIIIILLYSTSVAAGQRGLLGPGHHTHQKGVNTKQTYSVTGVGTYILWTVCVERDCGYIL